MGCRHCGRRYSYNKPNCVVRYGNRYFALYVHDRLFRKDDVVIKRISKERYEKLLRHGVKRCKVID